MAVDALTVKMQGFDELRKKLKQLAPNVQNNTIKQSLRKQASKLLAQIRANYPAVRTGTTKKSFKVRARRGKPGVLSIEVASDWYISRFQELGWTKKTKTGSRKFKGNNYVVNTYNSMREQLIKEFETDLSTFIDKRF